MTLTSLLALLGACIIAFRIFKQREMHVDRLWIVPLVAICLLAASYGRLDFSLSGCALMALGVVAGCGLGWARARLSIASIDVANRRIVTKAGAWMLILVVAMPAIKLLVKNSALSGVHQWVNLGLLLAVTSICTQRLYFYRAYTLARDQGPAPHPSASN